MKKTVSNGIFRGCLAALVLAVTVGCGFSISDESSLIVNMPSHVDTFGTVQIDEPAVPLADTKVTTSTKTSSKKVKMKTASKKTYSKVLPASTSTKKSTVTKDGDKISKKTVVKTQVTEKYTKKSKTKQVVTKTVTTVTTTTVSEEATVEALDIGKVVPEVSDNVVSAFKELGFKAEINSGASYEGLFSAEKRLISVKKQNENLYHEVGHFVAFVTGGLDTGTAFKAVYAKEKKLYDGRNPEYILSCSEEYFAESYKEFILDPDTLAEERPETYASIKNAVSKITDSQVNRIKIVYAGIWN